MFCRSFINHKTVHNTCHLRTLSEKRRCYLTQRDRLICRKRERCLWHRSRQNPARRSYGMIQSGSSRCVFRHCLHCMMRRHQISGNWPSVFSVNLLTFLRHVPRTKRSPEQQGQGTNSAYRRWCGRCGSSSAFLTLIMVYRKEISSRLSIPSVSGLFSLGLSLCFSRERCLLYYTTFPRQISPAFRHFITALRQFTSAIDRRLILSLTTRCNQTEGVIRC